jgi:hypothetical protein
MATTRGRCVAGRIVSFHRPELRPMGRGKEGKAVEFGPKAHVALVDGDARLVHAQYEAFHEGIQLAECLAKHIEGSFGHLKSHYNLNKVRWLDPGGETMPIGLRLIAFNLTGALEKTYPPQALV